MMNFLIICCLTLLDSLQRARSINLINQQLAHKFTYEAGTTKYRLDLASREYNSPCLYIPSYPST